MRSWLLIAIFLGATTAWAGHIEPPTPRDHVTYENGWYVHRSSDGTVWRSRSKSHGWRAEGRRVHHALRHQRHSKRGRRHRHR